MNTAFTLNRLMFYISNPLVCKVLVCIHVLLNFAHIFKIICCKLYITTLSLDSFKYKCRECRPDVLSWDTVGRFLEKIVEKFLPRGCFASSCWRSPVSLSPPPWRWGTTSSWSPASPVSVSVAGGSKQGRQEDLFAWTAGRPSWNCSKQ